MALMHVSNTAVSDTTKGKPARLTHSVPQHRATDRTPEQRNTVLFRFHAARACASAVRRRPRAISNCRACPAATCWWYTTESHIWYLLLPGHSPQKPYPVKTWLHVINTTAIAGIFHVMSVLDKNGGTRQARPSNTQRPLFSFWSTAAIVGSVKFPTVGCCGVRLVRDTCMPEAGCDPQRHVRCRLFLSPTRSLRLVSGFLCKAAQHSSPQRSSKVSRIVSCGCTTAVCT